MPILNGAADSPYLDDTTFKPVTTLTDDNEIPDYGVFFKPAKDYIGKEFAFDDCAAFLERMPHAIIDENFLLCRYERLFKFKVKVPPTNEWNSLPPKDGLAAAPYYLVPWLAMPWKLDPSGKPLANTRDFSLRVGATRINTEWYANLSGNKRRKLKLAGSGKVNALWESNQQPIQDLDIQPPTLSSINIHIPDGPYDAAKAAVTIQDITNGSDVKTVGKIAIIFLREIVQDVVFLEIEPKADRFDVHLLNLLDQPESLESDSGDEHDVITADANAFGVGQIGIKLRVKPDIHIFGEKKVQTQTVIADLANIMSPTFGIPNVDVFPSGISTIETENQYSTLLSYVLDKKIKHLEDNDGAKFSKYSVIYVFVTPFRFVSDKELMNKPGRSYTNLSSFEADKKQLTRADVFPISVAGAVNLFQTIPNVFPNFNYAKRYHEYTTLVHELAHALLAGHYFEDPPPKKAEYKPNEYKPNFEDFIQANRFLRLYLSDYFPSEDAKLDNYKIHIEDLKTDQKRTLFDDIIKFGMDETIGDFIDTKVYPSGRPTRWKAIPEDPNVMPVGEVVMWVLLNNLAKFKPYKTGNIMDYAPHDTLSVGTSNEAWLRRRPVRFDRFQWELLRKTVLHLSDLKP
jgi:hypothetical protein